MDRCSESRPQDNSWRVEVETDAGLCKRPVTLPRTFLVDASQN